MSKDKDIDFSKSFALRMHKRSKAFVPRDFLQCWLQCEHVERLQHIRVLPNTNIPLLFWWELMHHINAGNVYLPSFSPSSYYRYNVVLSCDRKWKRVCTSSSSVLDSLLLDSTCLASLATYSIKMLIVWILFYLRNLYQIEMILQFVIGIKWRNTKLLSKGDVFDESITSIE